MSDLKLTMSPDGYYPTVLGHELFGEVLATGRSVSRCSAGDLVVATMSPVCGACRYCLTGRGNLCVSGGSVVSGHQPDGDFRLTSPNDSRPVGQYCFLGSLAEEIVTGENQLMVVDSRYSQEPAIAMISCSLSTAAGAVYAQENFLEGATVCLVGAGSLGGCALMVLRSMGISDVTVVDPENSRRERAVRLGARRAIDPDDLVSERFDLVFEASMYGLGLPLALELTERGGRCITMGMPAFGTKLDEFNHWGLVSEQRTLIGTVTSTATPWDVFERILSAEECGKLAFQQLVDKYYYGLDSVPAAFEDAKARRFGKAIICH